MSDIIITAEYAEIICQMEDVCYGEGIGPNNAQGLMSRIFFEFPELRDKYPYLIPKI